MKHFARWMALGAVVALTGGCEYQQDPAELEQSEVELRRIEKFEQIEWRPTTMGLDWQAQLPGAIESIDPCTCTGENCIHDWVSSNFGCDVCVSYSCQEQIAHVCTSC